MLQIQPDHLPNASRCAFLFNSDGFANVKDYISHFVFLKVANVA